MQFAYRSTRFTKFLRSCFLFEGSSCRFACMKTIFTLLFGILLFTETYAQDAVQGRLEAYFDNSTGMISYHKHGEITKDGLMLIDLKSTALNQYIAAEKPGPAIMDAIAGERAQLETLRTRILKQRERLMSPLPPQQEVK